MKIVGLTGGIGSGKTTVANFFAENNNVVLYIADKEAKKLMNSSTIIIEKVVQTFGKEAYINNKLNRKYISNIVFKDKNKLAKLNAIVHPEVKRHFKEFVDFHKDKDYIIYENAILFESKSNTLCDIIITVYTDLETKIKRVIARDSSTRDEVLNRIKNQWKDNKKLHLSNYIILNLDLKRTQKEVERIHNFLTLNF